MLHLYFGQGKGKTSAAIGLGIRAAGHGKRVLMVQFLKCRESGECLFLKDCKNFTIKRFESEHPFIINPTPAQREKLQKEISIAFDFATQSVTDYNVIILDEVLDAVEFGFLNEEKLISLINIRNNDTEIIFTGRNPSKKLLELTDYATDMKLIKHPYQQGIKARKGIEY